MQISNTSNYHFGRFCKLNKNGLLLTDKERRIVGKLIGTIDEKEGKTLCVFADVNKPAGSNGHKHLRITTSPLMSDFEIIKMIRPEAQRSDYKRHSLWFELSDKSLKDKVIDFLIGQNGYIRKCMIDPNHSAKKFASWRRPTFDA